MTKIRHYHFVRASVRFGPGKASDYIKPFDINPDDRVLILCRVSNRQRKEHLKGQEESLRRLVESKGGIVVGVYPHRGSGFDRYVDFDSDSDFGPDWFGESDWLREATALAIHRDAKYLLAETTCRFVRHPEYHSELNPDAQARTRDLVALRSRIYGVIPMTQLHPDASPREVRSCQTKRGMQQSKKQPGRPRMKPEKLRGSYGPRATDAELSKLQPLLDAGYSGRESAQVLGRPHTTVCGWMKRLIQRCTN